MNNKVMTVSVLSAAVALAGCNSSSGGGAAITPFQCNAEGDLAALTTNDVLAVTADNACLVRFSLSDPSTVLAVGSWMWRARLWGWISGRPPVNSMR